MAQRRSGDIENSGSASTEALPATEGLAESRTSLSEWQTDPELKFYGRAMSSATSKRLAGQRLALEIYALVVVVLAASIIVGHRSKSEKALASSTSPRSPKTIPRVATP